MLPGYNHNIRYNDCVFHIQTEDSGVQNPHIITHLFVGGNIIETRKTSYADIVSSERLNELLVDLMQDQHKAMLKDLIAGRLDQRITARSVNAATLHGPAPLNVDAGAQQRASLWTAGATSGSAEARRSQQAQVAKPAPVTPREQQLPAVAPPVQPQTRAAPPPLPRRPVAPPVTAAASPAAPAPRSSFFGNAPPAAKIIEAETLQRAFDSRNENALDSIFGEDLISEKSLDEVILSYLAEDMQK